MAEYIIPACNLSGFTARVDDLNKRARRLKVAEITFKTETSRWEAGYVSLVGIGPDGNGHLWVDREAPPPLPALWKATGQLREWLKLSVEGDAPKFDGWSLIGVLEGLPTDQGMENLVKTVPGHEVPIEFRDRVGECDHCRADRNRRETFVVQHEDGACRVVGRQCLKDFLGHGDPHKLAALCELLGAFDRLCRDAGGEEWEGCESREPRTWRLEHVLARASATIRLDGWMSRAEAVGRAVVASADRVMSLLCGPRNAGDREWYDARQPEPRDEELAAKTAEWADGLSASTEPLSDYLYNLNLIARTGVVQWNQLGLVTSMVVAYQRAHEQQISRANASKLTMAHVGQVGKRSNFTVTCERVIPCESRYGTKGIHKLVDDGGHAMVWFASSGGWLEQGETYLVKATVKAHDVYKLVPQTVLTRVVVVEHLEKMAS